MNDKTKKKLSDAQKRFGKTGAKSHRWKGGGNTYRYKHREELAGRKISESCEICGAFANTLTRGLSFDHDHTTGKFRGWICFRCNLVLGHVKDSTDLLDAMIKYLKGLQI